MLVPEGGERAQEHDERVGRGAAVLTGVLVARERTHLDGDAGVPPERDRQGRLACADRAAVGDDDRVGAKGLGVLGGVALLERAADLLLPFDAAA